jgi:hypothetical protein
VRRLMSISMSSGVGGGDLVGGRGGLGGLHASIIKVRASRCAHASPALPPQLCAVARQDAGARALPPDGVQAAWQKAQQKARQACVANLG